MEKKKERQRKQRKKEIIKNKMGSVKLRGSHGYDFIFLIAVFKLILPISSSAAHGRFTHLYFSGGGR